MSLVIDESYLPATLTAPAMSDAAFAEFCSQFPDRLSRLRHKMEDWIANGVALA